jgi:hypothetical protein
MTLANRLRRLEQSIRRAAGEQRGRGPKTEEDWLAAFEEAGRRGWFDAEPDFPKALQFYREALQTAQSQAHPPWDPPEDFVPKAQEHRRRFEWRHGSECRQVDGQGQVRAHASNASRGQFRRCYRFAAVREGFNWLQGMAWRRARNIPPVGEAEYYELAAWLRANRPRLEARSLDALGVVDLGRGHTSAFNLELLMANGPRQIDAGALAEAVRRLKQKFEE